MKYTTTFTTGTLFLLPLAATGYQVDILPSYRRASTTTNPFESHGLDVELPDFDGLFDKVQRVSPLAKSILSRQNNFAGLSGIPDRDPYNLPWKQIEANPQRLVHRIEKINKFDKKTAPLVRFRSSIAGPANGEFFGRFILDQEERKKWDSQIDLVSVLYPIHDLDSANVAMGFGRYGDCARLGVGYTRTKAGLGITPREQMFLYGLQEFSDGSSIVWGTEMQDKYDSLLPPGKRLTRAKTHLFAAALSPTSHNTFDLEYTLQLDIGGNIPEWLTTPVMIDTIKNLCRVADKEFGGESYSKYMESKVQEDSLTSRHSLLMTP